MPNTAVSAHALRAALRNALNHASCASNSFDGVRLYLTAKALYISATNRFAFIRYQLPVGDAEQTPFDAYLRADAVKRLINSIQTKDRKAALVYTAEYPIAFDPGTPVMELFVGGEPRGAFRADRNAPWSDADEARLFTPEYADGGCPAGFTVEFLRRLPKAFQGAADTCRMFNVGTHTLLFGGYPNLPWQCAIMHIKTPEANEAEFNKLSADWKE